jgi:hypothetical protein
MASGSTTTTASNSSPLASGGASMLAARSPTEERSGFDRHHGHRRVAVGQVGGDPRHHSPQLVGTRRRVDRDHARRPTVEAHRPARHDVGRGLGEKAVGDVDDGRGHAVPEVEVGAAGGGGRPEMLDHVVPRALRPRRGRLCQVAEDRQRPSRAAPGERSEAHGRQVLCLVDDHVPVAPG